MYYSNEITEGFFTLDSELLFSAKYFIDKTIFNFSNAYNELKEWINILRVCDEIAYIYKNRILNEKNRFAPVDAINF